VNEFALLLLSVQGPLAWIAGVAPVFEDTETLKLLP
jgi:hypothetical protein